VTYLVEGDVKLRDGLRAMRMAKTQLDKFTAQRAHLEREKQSIIDAQADLDAQFRDANVRLAQTPKSSPNYNLMAAQVNYLITQRSDAARALLQNRQESEKLKDPRNQYIAAVVTLSDSVEAAVKQYETLAADHDVRGAVEQLNGKPGIKVRLGPSAQFQQELPSIRRERQKVNAGVVALKVENGVARVEVLLNGTVTHTMVLDSGASYVSIPWSVAEEVGMEPQASDPTVDLQIANGQIVKAKLIVLKAVSVGQFAARNVECVVAPRSVGNTPSLLGGSFLRNFIYSMDLAAGELRMSQVIDKGDAPAAATVAKPAEPVAHADPKGPMLVVSSPNGLKVSALTAGAVRLYDSQSTITVGSLSRELDGLQFTPVPRRSVVSYRILVQKPGTVYVFGQTITASAQIFGDDAANWERVDGLISGQAIKVCYQRHVSAGQKLSLQGFELSVAGDGIELRQTAW
jgi:clan AA aspartic protease (TIGR02281 family)